MKHKKLTAALLAEFTAYLCREERERATVEKYLHDIRCFYDFIEEKTLDKSAVLSFKEHLLQKYAISSVNSMLAALNSFFRFCGWESFCVKQLKVQRKTFCSSEEELTREEYLRLVRTAERQRNERLSLLLQTICGTGIRVSELRFITVEAVRAGRATVSLKGKTRTVFIVSSLQKRLLGYARHVGIKRGPLFVTKSGAPLNRSNIWREMKALCADAGVASNKVFPHNLRHLFARTFYGIERDIAKLADVLGHSSIETTRIYIVTTGEEHRRYMENLRLII